MSTDRPSGLYLPWLVAATLILILIYSLHPPVLDLGWDNTDEPLYNQQLSRELQAKSLPRFMLDQFDPWQQEGWFWRPTFTLRYGLTLLLAGPEPRVFHHQNLLLHSFATWLLALLVFRLYPTGKPLTRWLFTAVSALWFALYHARSEVIWWISASSILDAACWSLLSLHLWQARLTAVSAGARRWYLAGGTLACGLAIGARQEALILPVLLLGLELHTPHSRCFPVRSAAVLACPLMAALVCNIIAYRYTGVRQPVVSAATPTINNTLGYFTWHNLAGRLDAVLVFADDTLLQLLPPGWLLAAAFLAGWWILLPRGTARWWVLASVAAALLPPLQAGNHSLNNFRLHYLPSLFALPTLLLVAVHLLQGEQWWHRLLLWSTALQLAVAHGLLQGLLFPLQRDPLFVCGIILVALYAALRLAQTKAIPWSVLGLAGVITAGTLVELGCALPALYWWPLASLLVIPWWRTAAPIVVPVVAAHPALTLPALVAVAWSSGKNSPGNDRENMTPG